MTTEELKIKISVDTSDAASKVQGVKKQLGGIGDSAKKGTASASAGFNELRNSIDRVRNLQFADIIAGNLDKVTSHLKKTKEQFKLAFSSFKMSGEDFSNPFSKDYWSGAEVKNFGDLVYHIGVNLKEGFKSLGGVLKHIGTGFKNLGKAIKTALGGTAIIAIGAAVVAVKALVASIKNAINVSRQLKQELVEATKIGLDLKSYQEWGYILGSVGIEVDKLSDFMKTLAAEQNAVRDGNEETIKAFESLGISAQEAANLTQGELFDKTVRALQNMENEVERTSLAYRIFGEDDAANLINVLNLNSAEMERLINNYYLLGGAASDSLINKSTTLQGVISNLSTAWQGLKNTLAEAFMPAITAVVRWLTIAIAKINMFVRALFGYDIIAKSSGSKKTSTGIAQIGSSATKATKAVEKLKRTTMGFDELNVVTDPNTKSDSGSGDYGSAGLAGGASLLGEGLLSEDDLAGLDEFAKKIEKIKTTIQTLVPILLVGAGVIGAILCFMSGNILGGITFLAMAGAGVAIGIENGVWERMWQKISTVLEKVKTKFLEVWDKIKQAWGSAVTWFRELFANAWNAIKDAWGSVSTWFKNLWEDIKAIFTSAWNGIKEAFSSAGTWFGGIWNSIKQVFANVATWFKELFTTAWNNIKGVWNSVANWFDTKIVQPIENFFSGMWNGLTNGAKSAWSGIKSTFSVVADWFTNVFTKAWQNVKNVFSTGGKIFDGIKDGIVSAFTTVVNGIISGINRVIAVPFNAINSILERIKNISIAGIEPFSWVYTFDVPQIPRLAKGGITTGSTIANIGENGREAVLPLENNTGWMDMLADRIAARNSSPSKIVLKVGEKELGEATIKSINNITQQSGSLQLVLA